MGDSVFSLTSLNELLDAFNAHDLDRIMQDFSENAVMIAPSGANGSGARIEGREAIRAAFARRFEAQPNVQWTNAVSFMDGNRAITQWRVVASGSDGSRQGTDGCDIWTFRDGKVVLKDVFYKQDA